MTRFWRVALLSLLMALLPLRGWAWAVMPMPTQGQATTAAALHGAHAPVAASLHHATERTAPCHGPQATTEQGAEQGMGGTGQNHTCSLCDLCHAGVIVPPSWAWFHDAPPVSPPSWAVSAPHGRDGTDGLFRPPRA